MQNVLGAATHDESEIDMDNVVDLVLNPGDISIHHPNIIHGSEPNVSDRRRAGLTIRYIPPSTECTSPDQPVLMMRGSPVPGINNYRSYPPYRKGSDFPFKGCDTWNSTRLINPEDEPFFARSPAELDAAVLQETLSFVDVLGGRPDNNNAT